MRFLYTLAFAGTLALPACTLPGLSTSAFELPFQSQTSDALAESWTLGEVTGVTPEHYTVSLDRETGTTPNGSVRFDGNANGVYHTLWQTIALDSGRKSAFLLELSWDQYMHDKDVKPLVWVRIDQKDNVLGMIDNRAHPTSSGISWQSSTIRAAIPRAADAVTIGVGMFGQGGVSFSNLKVRMGAPESSSPTSEHASAYVAEFIDLISEQAMMREQIDWEQMRKDMTALSQGAQSPSDTYPALNFCVAALNDHHSRLLTPNFLTGLDESSASELSMPESERLADDIGYLWLPGILSFDEAGPRAYAATLARALEELDDCKGFVIDLRQDDGGNMWPMLAGLAPLLGAEVVGSFQYPNGSADPWWWRDGWSGQADIRCTEVTPPHTAVFPNDLPLALLTSRRTGSSGEATLVAFLGRPNTRTFGQATAGLSTGNSSIMLSDGALLLLTTSKYADRTGKLYGEEIIPDVELPALQAGAEDRALLEAQSWLKEMTKVN